ncbi:MAG: S46 family peptidase [Rikenellaceae bacterium]
MKKLFLLTLAVLVFCAPVVAKEGMWLLPFLKKLNIGDMQANGCKLSADDIYSVNQSAIKDAVVIFGGGCTGEIISQEGLVITNYHCGYGAVQQHSSLEHDYLKNGFWAMNKQEEIPTPGLSVTFIRGMEDVTDQILPYLNDKMSQAERNQKVRVLIADITKKHSDKNNNIMANVEAMFGGNQYFMFLSERFGDVRMVGAPPFSIGKYGGETDNWMWPRHKCDFSIFRVYASADNKSTAGYDKSNKPYRPKKHLTVSLKGYNDGDFNMILGFPGYTNRYMTSFEIDEFLEQDAQIRIFVRGERQKLMWEDMIASDKVRIQYSSKYSNSANDWKNSIGMISGLKKLDVRSEKIRQQNEFTAWVNANAVRKAKYGNALSLIEKAVTGRRPSAKELQYIYECLMNVESFWLARNVDRILKQNISATEKQSALQKLGDRTFKDYNQSTDRKITPRMLDIFVKDSGSALLDEMQGMSANDLSNEIFMNSIFVDQRQFNEFIKDMSSKNIDQDPAMIAARAIDKRIDELRGMQRQYPDMFSEGHRLYLAGLIEKNGGKSLMYPDANFTMRLTYGKIAPYWAADAVFYNYYTTLTGVMAKEDPTNPEFIVPSRLKELWKEKDFGRYAYKGDIPVAMLSTTDITGGNSGSPLLNGSGELIGLAFDSNWEAISGDIAFEPTVQRTICVDIRYVLFIIDKYAGAKHLIDEMTIVE